MSRTISPVEKDKASAPSLYGRPVVVEVLVRVKALAFREADGGYSVVIPEIDGCVTQGETIEEVERMAKELADTLLEMRHDEKRDEATRLLTEPMESEIGP